MARIVAVHGIGQDMKGEESLQKEWLPALRDGVRRAGRRLPPGADLACAFFGDVFRAGKALGFAWEPEDVNDPWEQELLRTWWDEAARVDSAVPPPGARGKARTPRFVQSALEALSRSKFFARIGERALIGRLKQVYSYFHDERVRSAAQAALVDSIETDTSVLIGHSLGSVVAYEGLCAHPDWPVRTFISLGSPLGLRNLIFDQLRPVPVGGKGAAPPGIVRWVNVADLGDVVAIPKELAPVFHGNILDENVHNGATAHDVLPYFTAAATGRALAAALDL
jgi:pimeloyl-ACP methyl ester carboxylesterase